MDTSKLRLDPAQLYKQTDPADFEFETTADLESVPQMIGQPRAVEAIKFGMGMEQQGYNIYALGPTGLGKQEMMRSFFEKRAAEQPVPPDWIYVHNFEHPHKPKAIQLPAGHAAEFQDDMEKLVEALETTLSAAFESEEYQTRRQAVMEEFKERQSESLNKLQEQAQEKGMALIRTPSGVAVAPMREGEVLSHEEVQELSEEEQEQIRQNVEELQTEMQRIMRQVPAWQSDMREELEELNREVADLAVAGLLDELQEKYEEYEEIVEHLQAIREDVVENAEQFLQGEEEQNPMLAMMGGGRAAARAGLMRRYAVNVVVDNGELEGAPVIYADHPTYQNLVGRVEHRAQMGALLTDFSLIKAGALHEANGGYLLLDVRKVLTHAYAWDGLKRALNAQEIRIESLGQALSIISTVSLEPEPIPLHIKIAMLGDPMLYYLLWSLDPEFSELFKVAADFASEMARDEENLPLYARLLATLIEREELPPFNNEAIARLIEHSARMVNDAYKLSIHLENLEDMLRESAYWAQQDEQEVVTAAHVQQAIDAQIYRSDRLRERMQEAILRNTILIDTQGEVTGQINGLAVLMLGNFAFGKPTRITARVTLGRGQVVDIEREVELGGALHSKGVLILTGFLKGRYAEEMPLSLSASLVFEQSYGGVEGDSASSAELYALLSAIAEVPIKQSFAVTGSVNQRGQVQAIGGVNEKIEGFFDICEARGLTGEQGVLIPASNVKHLMLRSDVVEAVEAGDFHVYAVETINQGIELLTGMPAGELDEEGNYPEGTFNARVQQRLREMAKKRKEFGSDEKQDQEGQA